MDFTETLKAHWKIIAKIAGIITAIFLYIKNIEYFAKIIRELMKDDQSGFMPMGWAMTVATIVLLFLILFAYTTITFFRKDRKREAYKNQLANNREIFNSMMPPGHHKVPPLSKITYHITISKNGDTTILINETVTAEDNAVYFWKMYMGADESSPRIHGLEELNLALTTPNEGKAVTYFVLEDQPREKMLAIVPLPSIEPKESRTIVSKFTWPKVMSGIAKSGEDTYTFMVKGKSTVAEVEFKVSYDPRLEPITCEMEMHGRLKETLQKINTETQPCYLFKAKNVQPGTDCIFRLKKVRN